MTGILLVGAGGFLGANVRFAITLWSVRRYGSRFPLSTLIANVAGSFLLGLVLGILTDRVTNDQSLRLLIATGFLGAETTFSAFAVESIALLVPRTRKWALLNIALSIVASLAAIACGLLLAYLLTDVA